MERRRFVWGRQQSLRTDASTEGVTVVVFQELVFQYCAANGHHVTETDERSGRDTGITRGTVPAYIYGHVVWRYC